MEPYNIVKLSKKHLQQVPRQLVWKIMRPREVMPYQLWRAGQQCLAVRDLQTLELLLCEALTVIAINNKSCCACFNTHHPDVSQAKEYNRRCVRAVALTYRKSENPGKNLIPSLVRTLKSATEVTRSS